MLPASAAAFDAAGARRSLLGRRAADFDLFPTSVRRLLNKTPRIDGFCRWDRHGNEVRSGVPVRRLRTRFRRYRRGRFLSGRTDQCADAEKPGDRQYRANSSRQPVVQQKICLTDVAETAAMSESPFGPFDFFAAFAAKSWFVKHVSSPSELRSIGPNQ